MKELTRKMVDAVGDAFNANDIDEVMQYFASNRLCKGRSTAQK